MREITPGQVTPALEALLPHDGHAYRRCLAVLDGLQRGRILTDDPAAPTWAAAQERFDGTLFLGGALDRALVGAIVAHLARDFDVVIGAPAGDPLLELLPPDSHYDGADLDFWDRDPALDLERLAAVPPGLRLARIDADLLPRCAWGTDTVRMFGGVERALAHGLGYCLLAGETIVSEAFAGPRSRGAMEMGTITHPAHRGRGYATIVCARAALECERQGAETWWNCARQNQASAAIARRLGYRQSREYRVLAWFTGASANDGTGG